MLSPLIQCWLLLLLLLMTMVLPAFFCALSTALAAAATNNNNHTTLYIRKRLVNAVSSSFDMDLKKIQIMITMTMWLILCRYLKYSYIQNQAMMMRFDALSPMKIMYNIYLDCDSNTVYALYAFYLFLEYNHLFEK